MSDQQGPADWTDDPVTQALRAPATPEELAAEAEYVMVFRTVSAAGRTVARPGRSLGRIGVAAATVMTTVVLSGGVAAAAYTQTLPGAVQEIAHGVLGPIGVPPAPAQRGQAMPTEVRSPHPSTPTPRPKPAEPVAGTTKPARPDPSPDAQPAARSTSTSTTAPVPSPAEATTPQATSTTPTPSLTAPAEPDATTPAPPPLSAPTITAAVSSTRVPWHGSVVVTGRVTADNGTALRRRPVSLLARQAGDTGWQVVARTRADRSGTVRLTATVDATTRLVLRSGRGVRSTPMRVAMVPSVSAWATTTASSTRIRVLVSGAQAGDTVRLLRRQGGQLVSVTTATLDARGRAVVVLPTTDETRLRVRLDRTPGHTAVRVPVRIPVASP